MAIGIVLTLSLFLCVQAVKNKEVNKNTLKSKKDFKRKLLKINVHSSPNIFIYINATTFI